MKLTVLVDNNTFIDRYYYGEPALCFFIEDNGTSLLLDTGYSGLFIKNARDLNVDLDSVTAIAISHSHNDHTGGLAYLAAQNSLGGKKVIAHPDAFKSTLYDGEEIGSPLTAEQLQDICNLILSKESVKISDNITFLGEIPSYNDFETREAIGTYAAPDGTHPDFVIDDTALAYNSGKGLFIITGCSHSGICNIIEHAKKVCNEDRVIGVIGGFHLFDVSLRLKKTIDYFIENRLTELYPCHCVSFAAKAEIHKHIPIFEVGVGLSITFAPN